MGDSLPKVFPRLSSSDWELHRVLPFHNPPQTFFHQVHFPQEGKGAPQPWDHHWQRQMTKLEPRFHDTPGQESHDQIKSTYTEAHNTMPQDSMPRILAGFRLHKTTTLRFCISSIGTKFFNPLTIVLGTPSPVH